MVLLGNGKAGMQRRALVIGCPALMSKEVVIPKVHGSRGGLCLRP